MLHFTRWKIFVTLLTCLAGLLVALPNFFSKETVQSWPSFMPKQQLTLGLDLQGGAHLLLAMDQDEIKKDWINNLRDEARKELRDAKIGFTGIGKPRTRHGQRPPRGLDRSAGPARSRGTGCRRDGGGQR